MNWWARNVTSFVHPDDKARVQTALVNGNNGRPVECRIRHSDGSWRVLESFSRDLSHVAGVNGMVVNARDITERRRLEEQLHHSQRLEAVGRLAGGVAHDFNNLLMVITGYSHMLLDAMHPSDPARQDLEQVVKASERATDLTRQLLAFSRRQGVRASLVNLNALVQEMDRMLRRVLGEEIELTVRLAPELKAVRADPGQIEQVILNMVVNARDAMPSGGQLLIETRNSSPPCADSVIISISDTGIGMDSQVLSRVFEPFFTTKEHGTGLGLATSYGIIKENGGDLRVESTPAKGTTFRIELPVAEQTSEDLEVPKENQPPHGTETILLVEDEDPVRRVVETMLKRHGYQRPGLGLFQGRPGGGRTASRRDSSLDHRYGDAGNERAQDGGVSGGGASGNEGAVRFRLRRRHGPKRRALSAEAVLHRRTGHQDPRNAEVTFDLVACQFQLAARRVDPISARDERETSCAARSGTFCVKWHARKITRASLSRRRPRPGPADCRIGRVRS